MPLIKQDDPAINTSELPAKMTNAITAMRRTFKEFTSLSVKFDESRRDIAPKFMTLYVDLQKELGVKFQFNQYIHLLDPSCPLHRDEKDGRAGYRNHKSYQAGLYLQRLVRLNPRGEGRSEKQANSSSPLIRLARVLKVIQPMLGPRNEHVMWEAVKSEYGLSDATLTSLQNLVQTTQPLLALQGLPKNARITASIIHMPRPAAQATATPQQPTQGVPMAVAQPVATH